LYVKQGSTWQLLLQFVSPDGPAREHQSVKRVTEAVQELGLSPPQLERIRKAVTEALRKAAKRGHQDQPDLPATVRVWISDAYTEDRSRPSPNDEQGGRQEHRGWGFFLIQKQEDGPQASAEGAHHLVELFLYQERVLARERGREDRHDAGTDLC
jgi:anti-sigma regulatory factor (Ser/Thr protein kinase)